MSCPFRFHKEIIKLFEILAKTKFLHLTAPPLKIHLTRLGFPLYNGRSSSSKFCTCQGFALAQHVYTCSWFCVPQVFALAKVLHWRSKMLAFFMGKKLPKTEKN
jgi:hypothetical protein